MPWHAPPLAVIGDQRNMSCMAVCCTIAVPSACLFVNIYTALMLYIPFLSSNICKPHTHTDHNAYGADLCLVGVPSAASLAKVSRMQRNRIRQCKCQTRLCSREARWLGRVKLTGTFLPCGQSIFFQAKGAMARQIDDEQAQLFFVCAVILYFYLYSSRHVLTWTFVWQLLHCAACQLLVGAGNFSSVVIGVQ